VRFSLQIQILLATTQPSSPIQAICGELSENDILDERDTRNSCFNNLPFGGIDSDIVDLVSCFKPDKSAERTVDVVSLAGFFSDLTVLDTA
jgi:hypothetical protein